MSDTRATKDLETPIGKVKVVINAFITGGEMMDLEGVAVGAGVKSVDGRSGDVLMAADKAYKQRLRKLAEIMIVSIGDETDTEKKWIALRNLQGPDYSFVMKEIEKAAAGIPEDEGKA